MSCMNDGSKPKKITEKEMREFADYYKGKDINEADRLLISTSQNSFKLGYEKAKQEAETKFNELSKNYIHLSGRLDEEKAKQKEFIEKLKEWLNDYPLNYSDIKVFGIVTPERQVIEKIDKLSSEVFGGSDDKD